MPRNLDRIHFFVDPPHVRPVLVCRTAWMDFYRGAKGDRPKLGGAYVEEEGFGNELFNFLRGSDGRFRGYVRPPGAGRVRDQRINIDRLGAATDDERVDGVIVFWAATHPALGGTRVVGWYDNASVFRAWQPSPKKRLLPNGQDAGFMVKAKTAKVLPSDDRLFVLPRANSTQTGIGQSNLWYVPPDWSKRLLDYRARVLSGKELRNRAVAPNRVRMADTDVRLRIERAAMAATIAWCEERRLPCRDVSLQRLGWDIEAGVGRSILRIEVKGSSLPLGAALLELTPNEYAKLAEHRRSFRLSVVSMATGRPELLMFAWSDDAGAWLAAGGSYRLKLHKLVSARGEVLSTKLTRKT